jgi:predicted metalloprotease with PDZ domain
MKFARWSRILLACLVLSTAFGLVGGQRAFAGERGKAAAIIYKIQIKDLAGQTVDVEASFPVSKAREILYLPVWTPGYYVKEDHKKNVVRIQAYDDSGRELAITDAGPNRWAVDTRGSHKIVVRYGLSAKERSVSRNEVTPTYAVLNGSATYITVKGDEHLSQEVLLELPEGWKSAAGLRKMGVGEAPRFAAADYEELVDSPILAGDLEILDFTSKGTPHQIAYNRGAVAVDKARVVSDLKTMVDETRGFWGEKPWRNYAFLIAFRDKTGGGLEHAHSTFVNVNPERFATEPGYNAFVALLAHEYQHAFNVKRLRPVELGPFDYEVVPTVSTLWISEGLTSYYSNLMLRRSGLIDDERYLGMLSKQITALQNSPGRLKQSLEQSSMGVWSNSLSGVGASDSTVSYYVKGEVAGFLLDAHIREVSGDKASLDDVMRKAYGKYSGKVGFRPEQFTAVAESVSGQPLKDWFSSVVGSPGELDYAEALDAYGLDLTRSETKDGSKFVLSVSTGEDQTQAARRKAWLGTNRSAGSKASMLGG